MQQVAGSVTFTCDPDIIAQVFLKEYKTGKKRWTCRICDARNNTEGYLGPMFLKDAINHVKSEHLAEMAVVDNMVQRIIHDAQTKSFVERFNR